MFDFLTHTIEYQNWGWNLATFGALGTIGFTCWQLWALWDQYQNIKTGEAVSVGWHTYFGADFLAYFFYSLYAASIAMTFNSLLGLGHLLVLWGLRIKQFRLYEWLLLPTIVLFPGLMYFSSGDLVDIGITELTERQLLFLLFSFGTLFALAQQPWEMYRSKSRGDVSFVLLLAYSTSSGFWFLFVFFGTNDVVLQFLVVTAGSELLLTLWLWFKYKPKSETIMATDPVR